MSLDNLFDDERFELLSYLLNEEDDSSEREIQPLENREDPILSFGQERLWFLEQLKPGTAAYHIVGSLHLIGSLQVAALEYSFNQVIQRHESLRTTIETSAGRPQQKIASHLILSLPTIHLHDDPEIDRQAQTYSIIQEETRRPFDLTQGPLLRATLLHLAEQEYVLVLCMHHIVADGWSLSLFFQELAAFYTARIENKETPDNLKPLSLQYADYAAWQRTYMSGETLEKELDHWVKKLSGRSLVLPLPIDHPRPATQSWQGKHYHFQLPAALTQPIAALARQENVTLFMLLLAVFETLLYRYTGQSDILVGTPIANRQRSEVESIIGLFVNTVILRADLSNDSTFRQLLQQVREEFLDASEHQDLPFEVLVDKLQPQRDTVHTPIFQVVFVLQNTPETSLNLPGLTTHILPVETDTAKFDLTLTMEEHAGQLHGMFEYNTDILETATIERMVNHFQVLLNGVIADPGQCIGDLPMLTDTEQKQLLHEWNPTGRVFTSPLCLHQWFEKQAAQTPNSIAVTFRNQNLTYRQLDERANQLGHHLQKMGIEPDTLVGLYLDRSLEMVIAILGVLKAGGAYLPIDLTYPKDRQAFMLADAKSPVLLTQVHLLDQIPEAQAQVLCLDSEWDIIAQQPTVAPISAVGPAHIAYVIYTSGSTGRPKGVMVCHENVTRLFTATDDWYHFSRQDVWTLFHSYAFDFSVWEIWGALLYGGRLLVVPYEISRTPEAFYQMLAEEQVTVLNQTPSAFRQLISTEQNLSQPRPDLALRYVIFGGEALELNSLRPWFDRHGDQIPQLINMYGITETTVHVTYCPIRLQDLQTIQVSPIGIPIPDLQVYILDTNQKLVPVGIPGEMYVGGAGLARGYLNRPDLSAERFVRGCLNELPEARLYKTGDLARYLPDGQLEYLGRCDDQVKIRGFRIELGEIEAILSNHPAVRETVVITRSGDHGDKQLVAYIVLKPNTSLNVNELREYLKKHIPHYMIPAMFVMLPELPLTVNGKVNRSALPDPGSDRPDLETPYVKPQSSTQKMLADIWSEVLDVERIGIQDNFFALGGDSIRSVRILALARDQGLNFSLEQFFQYQTIAELTQEIETKRLGVDAGHDLHIGPFALISAEDRERLPREMEDAYPLSMLQAGMLYHMAMTPNHPVYHNVDSFHLRTPFNEALFRQAVQTTVMRHPILRTGFDLTSYSEPLQLVHPYALLSLTVEDMRHLAPEAQKTAIQARVKAEKQRPFHLDQPSLIRFHIQRRTDDTIQFTLTECHAIFDGWSLTSTLAEIFNRYSALLNHAPQPASDPLSIKFCDFIALERATIQSEECKRFWANKLDGITPLHLPRRSSPLETDDGLRMRIHPVSIPADVVDGLNQLVRSAGIALKSILLASHIKVMEVLSGQKDVVTGLVFNGRPEEKDGDQVRGLFLNTLPLRMQMGTGSWLDLIQATFQAEREILPYRRYPLAELQKSWGREPLLDNTYNFVHFHALEGMGDDSRVEMLELSESSNENHFTLAVSFSLNPAFWNKTMPIALILQYDLAEFSEDQIERMGHYFVETLRAIVADPHARYETFSPLGVEERQKILVEWTNTTQVFDLEKSAVERFVEQAALHPNAQALSAPNNQTMSYAALDRRSNQLANYLRSAGVGPDIVVAICTERSFETILGQLAIMKAGGAYLPLDPAYPKENLAFILQDAQATILLTQSSLLHRLPAQAQPVFCIDQDWQQVASQPETLPQGKISHNNLAYIIYTSGSTGQPKGVEITHHNLTNLCCWHQRAYAITPEDRASHLAGLAFDASVWEVWPYLTAGASIHLPDENLRLSPAELLTWLAALQITVSFMPTPLAEAVLEVLNQAQATSLKLRWLLTGGDRLHRRLKPGLGFSLVNNYGPTENTVVTTYSIVNGKAENLPAIGRPIDNVRVYVLDQNQLPVPVGVPGELYIGGDSLARGYINRPELTQEKFVENPFVAGQRLYRSGDLVRWLPNGELDFLGRIDTQIKIRGFRIEPGEIEAALLRHPAIREAVVLAREDSPADKRLVAYLVCTLHQTPDDSTIRAFLKTSLPEHMIPSAFLYLPSIPLTPNGKVDHKTLPVPEYGLKISANYIAPQTTLEIQIAKVWQECLHIEKVGQSDNFFDMGGHSLLLVQAHGRLCKLLERKFSIVEMFHYPTVSALAKRLSQTDEDTDRVGLTEQRVEKMQDGKNRLKQLQQKQRTK